MLVVGVVGGRGCWWSGLLVVGVVGGRGCWRSGLLVVGVVVDGFGMSTTSHTLEATCLCRTHCRTPLPHPTAAPHCHTPLPPPTTAPHCRTPLPHPTATPHCCSFAVCGRGCRWSGLSVVGVVGGRGCWWPGLLVAGVVGGQCGGWWVPILKQPQLPFCT